MRQWFVGDWVPKCEGKRGHIPRCERHTTQALSTAVPKCAWACLMICVFGSRWDRKEIAIAIRCLVVILVCEERPVVGGHFLDVEHRKSEHVLRTTDEFDGADLFHVRWQAHYCFKIASFVSIEIKTRAGFGDSCRK